jgi:hypothetical protein
VTRVYALGQVVRLLCDDHLDGKHNCTMIKFENVVFTGLGRSAQPPCARSRDASLAERPPGCGCAAKGGWRGCCALRWDDGTAAGLTCINNCMAEPQ